MRNTVLILLILTLFACGGQPGTKATKTPVNTEKTTIKFEEETHSFGKLTAGEIVLFTFEFTNTGTTDYRIESVHSDCGCVKTYYTKEPVKPGKTGIIELEFDTSGLVGREYKTIEVSGNSTELKHLAIFAEVKNEFLDIKY
uniref:DUF1573 domain-containing protein n=1 Tax=uncultured Draconibacterium sp. TaxID=1573823 RepID=UPI0032162C91